MATWWEHLRRVAIIALAWALTWAPLVTIVGWVTDPNDTMDEMWPAIGAYPGFLSGVLFGVILLTVARHQRLDEITLRLAVMCGAASGLLVGLLPFVLGTLNPRLALWQWGLLIIGSVTVMSALSALVTILFARRRHEHHPAAPTA